MPIYEYECAQCGKRQEVLQRADETPQMECSECGGSKMQRVLSAGSFVFKGSGFYATDYKNHKPAEKPACSACSEAGGCPAAGARGVGCHHLRHPEEEAAREGVQTHLSQVRCRVVLAAGARRGEGTAAEPDSRRENADAW